MIVYKDREMGICSLNRIINKLKMERTIESGIQTNNKYNRNIWEPIGDILV
jgi:hypothetical protein